MAAQAVDSYGLDSIGDEDEGAPRQHGQHEAAAAPLEPPSGGAAAVAEDSSLLSDQL
jgi:hypothetical protein